jgi:hypothetical protein
MDLTEQLPEFPDSTNLMIESKPLLDLLFQKMQPQISELTFTNLFVWNRFEPVQISRLDEVVLLHRKRVHEGRNFIMPPERVAKGVVFLVSEDSKIISEASIPIYGRA